VSAVESVAPLCIKLRRHPVRAVANDDAEIDREEEMDEHSQGAVTAAADAGRLAPPRVPPHTIEVPPGHEVFLVGHAVGTQNYICLPSKPPAAGSDWVLFAPEATLFDHEGLQIVTHFASPSEPGGDPTNPLATWQSKDNSAVWATRETSLDSPSGSIPWLLLKVVAARRGKAGGHRLTKTTYIQRVNTIGGVKPPTGCAASTDTAHKNFVAYTADYFFYRRAESD
jgi:hypothetical protein